MKNYYSKLALIFLCIYLIPLILRSEGNRNNIVNHDLLTQYGTNCFIENKGQWDNSIKYLQQASGINTIITGNNIIFDFYNLRNIEKQSNTNLIKRSGHVIGMRFGEVQSNFNIQPVEQLPEYRNYFIGSDEKKWRSDVKLYKKLSLKGIYDGIDAELVIENNRPRYNFILSPNSNPEEIILKFTGCDKIDVNSQNELVFHTSIGDVINGKVYSYQKIDGYEKTIECGFVNKGNSIGFKLGSYDKSFPLVIDPIVFSTYLGGSSTDEISDIASGQNGEFSVCGFTKSNDLRITPGAYDSIYHGNKDIFISKLFLLGTTNKLVFTTYIGGNSDEQANALALDINGNIYITGYTASVDFPRISSFSQGYSGGYDAIISKLSSDGKRLVYSSCLGGFKDDVGNGIAVPSDSSVFIIGTTNSTDLPIKGSAYQLKMNGVNDAFIAKISSAGNTLVLSTYFGGSDDDIGKAIAADNDGTFYIIGDTKSGDFPVWPFLMFGAFVSNKPYDYSYNGGWDAWVAKMTGNGGQLEFSTYFGGNSDDHGKTIAYDVDGTVFISGDTKKESGTPTFPVTGGTYSSVNKGGTDGFFAKLLKPTAGTGGFGRTQDISFSSLFGSTGDETVEKMFRDTKSGYIYITGTTNTKNFPIIGDDSSKYHGKTDAFFVKFSKGGESIALSSLFGGSQDENGKGIAIDARGDIYIAGNTTSSDLPISNCYVQPKNSGGDYEGFVAKFIDGNILITSPSGKETFCPGKIYELKWVATNIDQNDTYTIDYKRESDTIWTNIVKDVKGPNYSWKLPSDLIPDKNYHIRISHYSGLYNINLYPFSVIELPSIVNISTYPESFNVCENAEAKITVTAKGENTNFKWYYNDNQIQNAGDSTFVFTAGGIYKTGIFKCEVTGFCQPSVVSQNLKFTLLPATKIISAGHDTIIKKGGNIIFKISAVGLNLIYEWRKDFQKILGASDSMYSINGLQFSNGGKYQCIVTGDCGIDSSFSINLTVDTTSTSVRQFEENDIPGFSLDVISINSDNDLIKVNINSVQECITEISLFDNNGRFLNTIYKGLINTGQNEYKFDASALIPGVYWLTGECSGKKAVRKFIKN